MSEPLWQTLDRVTAKNKELCARIADLERQLTSMRASFHVNMVRAFPAKSHEEISAEIDRALEITGVRK